ncbi:MAG TPA: hypothetical protein VFL66_04860 [Gaiellaceae bacterium]|nr:hypothetical protein [Gaiellaceae bacterium]
MTPVRALIAALVVAVGVAAGFAIGRGTEHRVTTVAQARTVTAPPPGMPAAVERTRRRILAAAEARDYDALGRIAGTRFRYSFGPTEPGGAPAYWRQLERSGHGNPLRTLAAIMRMPYTLADGYYVWPFAYDKQPGHLGAYERQLLAPIAGPKEIAGWQRFGGYLGWRAGIAPDGSWAYYVTGD